MKLTTFSYLLLSTVLISCVGLFTEEGIAKGAQASEVEPEKGEHNGRMLRADKLAVELAIVEAGVPPEFRVWVTHNEQPVAPEEVEIQVRLTRLGNVVDTINFAAADDYLRGDMVVYEPHSFEVRLTARYQGEDYSWEYENFEGRTLIADATARAMGVVTAKAENAILHETLRAYGKLRLPPAAHRQIKARFEGEIKEVLVQIGAAVTQGQHLLTIESNESLQAYQVTAPMSGEISQLNVGVGEQTDGRTLLAITDASELLAELAVYPTDRSKVRIAAPVSLLVAGIEEPITSQLSVIQPSVRDDQATVLLASVNNRDGRLAAGLFVSADIEINTVPVNLAVKRTGLQSFRDFTVVYAKVGEEYEVRMLELGRAAGDWVEVLGGLEPGTEYVSENSYIIKADIEKSGASHDH